MRKGFKSLLLSALLLSLLCGCALTPVQEQLVSSSRAEPLAREEGSCSETLYFSEIRGTGRIPPELVPDRISILNWNVFKGQRAGWDADLLAQSRSADIIFLQEAPLNERLRYMLGHMNLYWNLNSAFTLNGVETGVLIASSIRPLESCGLRRSEPLIVVPKTILVNRYQIAGFNEELLAANIHGINITFGTLAYRRQLDALQAILEGHRGPLLLVGDFNNWSEKRTAIMQQLAMDLSLQRLDFEGGERTTFLGEAVDQVLYRGLEPLSQRVQPVISSDHNPIRVTFRVIRGDKSSE